MWLLRYHFIAELMARIFSINFYHEGIRHSALVSVRQTPFASEYTLSMMAEELLESLPVNKILSATPSRYLFAGHGSRPNTPLMDTLIQALSEHVEADCKKSNEIH